MKAGDLVDRIQALDGMDLPVVIAVSGDSRHKRAEPTHVEVQRICHNSRLRYCVAPRCESAFMALVIS
jgi:hypothetical protein